MLSLILPLIALLILFGLAFALVETWDQLKFQIIARLIVLVLFLSVVAFGVRYRIVNAVGCLPNCVGTNLVGRELGGLQLVEANFVGSNLSGADLSRARLRGANLSGTNLVRANLEGADLRGAKLLGAKLDNANLAGANLIGATLNGADMVQVDLTGVDLTQTSLLGVRLDEAELESVNLTGVNLIAVDMVGAKLNGAQLINTDLSGATLSGADLSGAQLSGSNLSGAWLNLATLIGANLTNADLSGASLIGADLASADFSGSRLVGATLVGTNMSGANLNGVNMLGARMLLEELTEADQALDPLVASLNELQQSQILLDASWDGATFDSQTVWPSPEVNEEVAATIELIESSDTAPVTDTIKVGILHSLSGPMAISEVAVRDATLLAIDEINATGGVLGQPLEAVVEDGASIPEVFEEKVRKLLETDQVPVIFGGWTSDSRKTMIPTLEELNGLLFYPVQYEGFEQSPNIFYLGPEPSQQLIPAVNYLLEQELFNILLVGSEFAYSRVAHTIIRVQLQEAGYQILGELYVPLGETDFGTLMEQLRASSPDAIINTMYGESNVAFFQQLAEAGFPATILPVLSTSVAEEEVRIIGADFLAGHFTTWNYFQTLQSPENFTFVSSYKNAYGQERVTSSPIAAAYTSVYAWRELVEKAESTEVDDVRAAATEPFDYIAPSGPLQMDETQHTFKTARIGVIREDGLIEEVFSSEEQLEPDPFLTNYSWSEVVQEMLESFQESE